MFEKMERDLLYIKQMEKPKKNSILVLRKNKDNQ